MSYILYDIPCMAFRKIPAAAMIIPMFLSIIFNSLFPDFVNMGSLTTALFGKKAVVPLTGVVLFMAGTGLRLNEAPEALKRGGMLLLGKFAAGYVTGTIFGMIFGPAGVFGVSALAVYTALLSSNGSIYLAITAEYGEDIDLGAYSLLSLKDGPFLAMVALGASGATHIPLMSLFATIFPMLFGIVLGNLYPGVRNYFKGGSRLMIPFVGISIGSSINLGMMFSAGIGGVLLGVVAFIVGAIVLTGIDKLILRRPGYAGASLASVAGSAVATPTIIAGVVPELTDAAALASVQIAAAVIVTAILCPMWTAWVLKKWGAPQYSPEVEHS